MTWLDGLTFETVIVHTTEGLSVKGLMAAKPHDDCLILRDAYLFEEGAVNVLNGEICVPREKVLFLQRVQGPVGPDGRVP